MMNSVLKMVSLSPVGYKGIQVKVFGSGICGSETLEEKFGGCSDLGL